jgi:hypothetical protein
MERQVTCVKTMYASHEGITDLGGPGWRGTRQDVINAINAGEVFYTFVGGRRADVAVHDESGKVPYLQTHADGYWNNNLLALQSCPW